jgi:Cu/Ag efflux pump CusA
MAADESGSEIQTPMAIMILPGLTTAPLLNMFVVATLYVKCGEPVLVSSNATR